MRWRHAQTGSEHRSNPIDRQLNDLIGTTSMQVGRLRRARCVKYSTESPILHPQGCTIAP